MKIILLPLLFSVCLSVQLQVCKPYINLKRCYHLQINVYLLGNALIDFPFIMLKMLFIVEKKNSPRSEYNEKQPKQKNIMVSSFLVSQYTLHVLF